MKTYELTPRAGVELLPHVGTQVEISAVMVDAAKGGDDVADIEIEERTEVEREDAPDTKVETRTEAELPRGEHARLMVVSVKPVGAACAN